MSCREGNLEIETAAWAVCVDNLSGEEKAAMLVVLLGEETSGRMFQHLSKREVAKIARQIARSKFLFRAI